MNLIGICITEPNVYILKIGSTFVNYTEDLEGWKVLVVVVALLQLDRVLISREYTSSKNYKLL